MYPFFLQTLQKPKLYLQQWNITTVTFLLIDVMFMVLKLLFLVVFCYGECRGKSFQPNIFHALLLLWLRCPKSSLKSPYWCCKSNSRERKDALS